MLEKLGFHLSAAELQLQSKEFMRAVMKTWLPAADAMLDMIVLHLPSPVTAQAYRSELLYEGPLDDEAAVGKLWVGFVIFEMHAVYFNNCGNLYYTIVNVITIIGKTFALISEAFISFLNVCQCACYHNY